MNDNRHIWQMVGGQRAQRFGRYLRAYASDGYEVHEFRLAQCACGSESFELQADDDEGAAQRTCTACGRQHFICDSEEYWNDAEPAQFQCIACVSTAANIGVGFSLYSGEDGSKTAAKHGVRWLYIGVRCASCGVLGCLAGWKVATSDSADLLDKV